MDIFWIFGILALSLPILIIIAAFAQASFLVFSRKEIKKDKTLMASVVIALVSGLVILASFLMLIFNIGPISTFGLLLFLIMLVFSLIVFVTLVITSIRTKSFIGKIILVALALIIAFIAILFFIAATTVVVCDPVHTPPNGGGPPICDPVHQPA